MNSNKVKKTFAEIYHNFWGDDLFEEVNKIKFTGLISDHFSYRKPIERILILMVKDDFFLNLLELKRAGKLERSPEVIRLKNTFINQNFFNWEIESYIDDIINVIFLNHDLRVSIKSPKKEIGIKSIVKKGLEKLFKKDTEIQIENGSKANHPEEQLEDSSTWKDKHGVIYSLDKKRLIEPGESFDLRQYTVLQGVEKIEQFAFKGITSLETIDLPKNMNSIEKGVFDNCNFLRDFNFPDTLNIIKENAFRNCHFLTKLKMPSHLQTIEKYAFFGCRNVYELSFNNELKKIGEKSFQYTSLKELFFPEGLKEIDKDAFADCKNLETVYFPESLTKLNGNPFPRCASLRFIIIHPKNKSLRLEDGYLFCNDQKVARYTVPIFTDKVKSKYYYNSSKDKITDRYGVTYSADKKRLIKITPEFNESIYNVAGGTEVICKGAFEKNSNLKEINLPKTLRVIEDSAFFNCYKLTKIELPARLKFIGKQSFEGCFALTQISFPDRLEIIDDSAFKDCESLKKISFPKSLKVIGKYAFSNCFNIESIEFKTIVPIIEKTSFQNDYKITNISVPKERKSYYQSLFLTQLNIEIDPNNITML